MTVSECAAWLHARDNFIILTHRRPDGDTLGSAAALARSLTLAGKAAFVLANPETTERYLPFVEKHYAPDGFTPEHVLAVDIASSGMMPETEYAGCVSLAIDHHPSHEKYADEVLLDGKSASCGEIVFSVVKALGHIDAEIATALYIAVSTDTGCFSYENTTSGCLRAAAELVDLGAPSSDLNRMLFRSKTRGRIAVEGMVSTGMEFLFDDEAAIVTVTNEMLDRVGASIDDMENIAAFPVSIAGVRVGATIRQLKDGSCKVSVRSVPEVDSNAICARFGGGGHTSAAGFTSERSPAEVRELLIPVLGEFLGA